MSTPEAEVPVASAPVEATSPLTVEDRLTALERAVGALAHSVNVYPPHQTWLERFKALL